MLQFTLEWQISSKSVQLFLHASLASMRVEKCFLLDLQQFSIGIQYLAYLAVYQIYYLAEY